VKSGGLYGRAAALPTVGRFLWRQRFGALGRHATMRVFRIGQIDTKAA